MALPGLPTKKTGSGASTYGMFRDPAAPFGVAVVVPVFTNRITREIAAEAAELATAVSSIHSLAVAEIIYVVVGIAAVLMLPKIRKR